MKLYLELKLLSNRKIGDLRPLPKQRDKLKKQLYFDFYEKEFSSIEKKKKLPKKKAS